MSLHILGFVVNSGTTTVMTVIKAALSAGDNIILPKDIYYGEYKLRITHAFLLYTLAPKYISTVVNHMYYRLHIFILLLVIGTKVSLTEALSSLGISVTIVDALDVTTLTQAITDTTKVCNVHIFQYILCHQYYRL